MIPARYVLDTSVLAKAFIRETHSDLVLSLIVSVSRQETLLHAPTLVIFETNNVLVKSRIPTADREAHLQSMFAMISGHLLLVHAPDEAMVREAGRIADLDTGGHGFVSSYDATFHALALRERAILLTDDAAHYRKTVTSLGSIELIGNLGASA